MDISTNSIFELLENTNRSVFLTGKAGTGKTIHFLMILQRELVKNI